MGRPPVPGKGLITDNIQAFHAVLPEAYCVRSYPCVWFVVRELRLRKTSSLKAEQLGLTKWGQGQCVTQTPVLGPGFPSSRGTQTAPCHGCLHTMWRSIIGSSLSVLQILLWGETDSPFKLRTFSNVLAVGSVKKRCSFAVKLECGFCKCVRILKWLVQREYFQKISK